MHRHASKDVNHVNLGRFGVLVTAEDPRLRALCPHSLAQSSLDGEISYIVVVHVEDSEIPRVLAMRIGPVFAALRNPASAPVVPDRVGW